MSIILGKKIGMTRFFDKTGNIIPATIILADSCIVSQIKTKDHDGVNSVQLGFGENKKNTKPLTGHLKKSAAHSRTMKEFKVEDVDSYKIGQKVAVDTFQEGDLVRVSATSKGKGYAGVVKRHHFRGGPKSHGSDQHRAPGSIGSQQPQHVLKGRRMAGHMGFERITIKNLPVVQVDIDKNLLVLKGSVPGPKLSVLEIRKINA